MIATEATAEVFWTAFRALLRKEGGRSREIIKRLLKDREFMEDLIDLVILEQRQNESSRSLDECLTENIGNTPHSHNANHKL